MQSRCLTLTVKVKSKYEIRSAPVDVHRFLPVVSPEMTNQGSSSENRRERKPHSGFKRVEQSTQSAWDRGAWAFMSHDLGLINLEGAWERGVFIFVNGTKDK